MGKHCCVDTLDSCIVIIFNTIFLLVGAAVMIFGIIALATPQTLINGLTIIPGFSDVQYLINVEQALLSSGLVLTIVGGVIFVVCFIGLFGACIKSSCLVGTFIACVFIILLFELAVIIYFCVAYTTIQYRVQDLMFSSLKTYFVPVQINSGGVITPGAANSSFAWENLQFTFGCCGAHNYTDFQQFTWNNNFTAPPAISVTNALVPPSCCTENTQYSFANNINQFTNLPVCLLSAPLNTNWKGCYTAMMEQIAQSDHITIIIIASLIAIEVIVMMVSMPLATRCHKKNGIGQAI